MTQSRARRDVAHSPSSSSSSSSYSSILINKLSNRVPDAIGRNRKKSNNRTISTFGRFANSERHLSLVSTKSDQLESSATFNGRKSKVRQSRAKFGIDQSRLTREPKTISLLHDVKFSKADNQLANAKQSEPKESDTNDESRSDCLSHTLFPGHNQSNIISDRTDRSQASPADTQDRPKLEQLSEDSQSESVESVEHSSQRERTTSPKFSEHVKLEEAHLSAPPRAKLVCDSEGSDENGIEICVNVDVNCEETSNSVLREIDAVLLAGDDADLVSDSDDGNVIRVTEDSVDRDRVLDVITEDQKLTRVFAKTEYEDDSSLNAREKKDFRILERLQNSSLKTTVDFIIYEQKHSSAYVKVTKEGEGGRVIIGGDDVCQDDVAFSHRIASRKNSVDKNIALRQNPSRNLCELRNEVSVPEIKAETERQDLRSNDQKSASSDCISLLENVDDSEDVDSKREVTERLGISTVSLESMQVLEQFESIMLEVDRGDTANC